MSATGFGELLAKLYNDDSFRQKFFTTLGAQREELLSSYSLLPEERELVLGSTLSLSYGAGGVQIATKPDLVHSLVALQAKCSYCCSFRTAGDDDK